MNFVKQIIELVYYYRKDQAAGKPYWQDPAVIGLVLSLGATELAKYFGVAIGPELQLKIVGVITGIGALVSPQTGIQQHPQEKAAQLAARVQEQHRADSPKAIPEISNPGANIGNLS
ncbi:MAG: hypothetical protein ABSG91_07050 [Syntrophobacteraceae bacterium]